MCCAVLLRDSLVMIPHILYSVKRFLPIFQFFSKNFFLTENRQNTLFYILYYICKLLYAGSLHLRQILAFYIKR